MATRPPTSRRTTTEGTVSFYEYLGDGWGILFSHPKDFTPVCTTELGAFSARKADFDKRNTKLIGSRWTRWSPTSVGRRHRGDPGRGLNFPLIGDEDRKVADLYDMIHPNASDTLTVRSVFIDRARQEGEADAYLPGLDRAQRRRDPPGARLVQLSADFPVSTPWTGRTART